MQVKEYFSLKKYNTFGIECKARYFVSINKPEELIAILKKKANNSLFILGGGSNILFTKDINALVIHINTKGIRIIKETGNSVIVEAQAGENWHDFVLFCLKNNFGGVENLSLIPGNVGTAPIQNIGAYGVELQDVFESCDAISIHNQEKVVFSKEDCRFGYRNSIFKNEAKGKYIITAVRFKLSTKNHALKTSYGAIEKELAKKAILTPTIQDLSKAVIAIRQSKLPDPAKLGNSGSFFKNPIVSKEEFENFIKNNPEAPFYTISENQYKIPAGWLIEQVGFKGKRYGDAGVHNKQALVLVNYGNATGKELWDLAQKIKQRVFNTFNIAIEPEVNVIE